MDVLIIGAGPTGLFMALECAERGISCRIIDKEKGHSPYSKALAIQSRTLEIFDEMGIVQPFLDEGCQIECVTPMSQEKVLAWLDFSEIGARYPFILSLEQSRTEALLEKCLDTFDITVERETQLIAFQQTERDVIAIVRNTKSGQEEQITTSFLLGCDGAHSTVRKHLGLTFSGEKLPHTFALADVQISWQYPHNRALIFLDHEGLVAAFPLPGNNRYRVITLSEAELSSEVIECLLKKRSCVDVKVTQLDWQSRFQVQSRIVDKYSVNRVFVLGDAAHVHSPIGGQGMNTGLQDAHNLAPKLAGVIRGDESLASLESYNEERRQVGMALLKATRRATRVALCRSPWLSLLRNFCFHALMQFPGIRKHLMLAISQLALKR